jgi:hypothetical protein
MGWNTVLMDGRMQRTAKDDLVVGAAVMARVRLALIPLQERQFDLAEIW